MFLKRQKFLKNVLLTRILKNIILHHDLNGLKIIYIYIYMFDLN